MKKDLTILHPELFNEIKDEMQEWSTLEEEQQTANDKISAVKEKIKEHFKKILLEKTEDSNLKKILLQSVKDRGPENREETVIDAFIQGHMNDNQSSGYMNARVASQIHLMKKFDGVEDLFEQKFQLKEFNAEIWLQPRPYDEDYVILYVGETKEVLV
jgi:hypothetical protein